MEISRPNKFQRICSVCGQHIKPGIFCFIPCFFSHIHCGVCLEEYRALIDRIKDPKLACRPCKAGLQSSNENSVNILINAFERLDPNGF